jgi:hypothetical protein
MINKDEAIYNISKAYLEYRIANRLYWDLPPCTDTERDYNKTLTRFSTMRECYLNCDVLTCAEINDLTEGKYKVEIIKPTE